MTSILIPIVYTQQNTPLTTESSVSYAQLFKSWFPISNEQVELCSTLYDKFYCAVRLIDDVQDETRVNKNGKPTANSVFGVPLAINAGMLATVQLMNHILEFKNDKVTQVFLDEFKIMWEGQGEQLQWTKDAKCPSKDEVVKMSQKKGVLATLFGRILCALSGRDDSVYRNLFSKFNVLLQIENDMEGTASLKDITEGQYNFLTSYAVERESLLKASNRLEQILLSKTTDEKLLNEARIILIETGAFEFSNEYKNKILSEIINETKAIGGNQFCEDVLNIYGTKKLKSW
jgi:geranylgeranyl pyrophosphate synthase